MVLSSTAAADLRGADLRTASLRMANLEWANLSVADLREADDLSDAHYNNETKWPNDFDPTKYGVINADLVLPMMDIANGAALFGHDLGGFEPVDNGYQAKCRRCG